MGKVQQVSMPHAPNATVNWTVYNYDGLGRTVNVVNPDGSYKYYQYSANVVSAGDEAGKWKNFTMDVFGNLTSVVEPNPAGGTFTTTYAYDILNHLVSVSMPRPSGTQTRRFNYGRPPGAFLLSATNPETGTITYTYSQGRLASKTDAKNQQVQYTYDTLGRVTQVRHYPTAGGAEDTCQQVNFTYDTAFDFNFTYTQGRLASRTYTNCATDLSLTNNLTTNFTEMFSYTQAGQVAKKRLRTSRVVNQTSQPYQSSTVQADLDGVWAYDNEGKMTSVTYPSGAAYSYSYDAMGRPMGMTDTVANTSIINSVSYGPAGELLSIAGSYNEGRAYNSRLQLTALNGVTFNYPAANNGKISSQTDSTSGETVTYAYDALNRLITASSNQSWNQSYTYDGFGNLTQKVTQAGTFNTPVDATTNRSLAYGYDANGSQLNGGGSQLGYDVENRIRWASAGIAYGYDPDNRRIYKSTWTWDSTNGVWTSPGEEVHYYGITGQKLESYTLAVNGWGWNGPGSQPAIFTTMTVSNAYFGGKLIRKTGSTVYADRLGSFGKYYPYGEDRSVFPPNPANGTEKFGTYFRDADTGLDYAVNRYYMPGGGRFLTGDPYAASSGLAEPGSWNRYAYVSGDPNGFVDPLGFDAISAVLWWYSLPKYSVTTIAAAVPGQITPVLYPTWQALPSSFVQGFTQGPNGGYYLPPYVQTITMATISISLSPRDQCYLESRLTLEALKSKLHSDLASFWSMEGALEAAATKGGALGALEGAATGEVLGVSVGTLEGAIFGGVVGAVLTTAAAAITGPIINKIGFILSIQLGDSYLESAGSSLFNQCDRKFPVP